MKLLWFIYDGHVQQLSSWWRDGIVVYERTIQHENSTSYMFVANSFEMVSSRLIQGL